MSDKKRAYAYLRVSTMIQVDGKSLEGQREEIKKYCDAYDIELVHVYSDEGRSGKSVAGRVEFQRMLSDVAENKIDYVIVWKLSRFGRNVCDSLNALDKLQQHGAALIALQENLQSDGPMGKFIFTIFAAMAEMERENIIEQTSNGKKYNALDGNWNGGQAPYGYDLVDKKLVINEKEADVVRRIFAWYMENESAGYSTVTAKLNELGIPPRQVKRLDRKAMQESGKEDKIYLPVMEDWYTTIVKKILDCPVYCGKIRYGYYKVKSLDDGRTKREYSENPILVDGNHEAIISEELWEQVQEKRNRSKKAHGRADSTRETVNNVFNRIAKCPQCGGNMISYASRYTNVKGKQRVYYQYICGYWNNHKKGKCSKNPIKAEFLDNTVMEAVRAYVNRPNITEEIAKYMEKEMDTTKLEEEAENIRKELKELGKAEEIQYNILSQIGTGKYRNLKPEKISKNIDEIVLHKEELEMQLENKESQINAVNLDKLDFEMIKSLLVKFNDVYEVASKELRKKLVQSLVKEVRLGYDDRGKVIPVSMTLNFTGEQIELMKDNREIFELKESRDETVVLLTRKRMSKDYNIEIKVPIEIDSSREYVVKADKATYTNIKKYIMEKYGVNVHTKDIAEVKRDCGLEMRLCYHQSENENYKKKLCVPEKRDYIVEALKHYNLV